MEMAEMLDSRTRLFASTSWTLVLEAGEKGSSDQAGPALTQLCTIYWQPVYIFLLRQGYNQHDAQDLTQGFFTQLIERRFHLRADPEKGRFRSFLLGALKHFVANHHEYNHAQKRGGKIDFVPLSDAAEQEIDQMISRSYRFQAEDCYEREWAVTLLRRVVSLLEEECRVAGKDELFTALKPFLGSEGAEAAPYEILARRLSRPMVTLRKDVSRLRQRYRAILRREVRQTVADDAEVEGELLHLRAVMAA